MDELELEDNVSYFVQSLLRWGFGGPSDKTIKEFLVIG